MSFWCGRGDLNPHAFRRHPLKMVCLPVPPLPHRCPATAGQRFIITKQADAESSAAAAVPGRLACLRRSDIFVPRRLELFPSYFAGKKRGPVRVFRPALLVSPQKPRPFSRRTATTSPLDPGQSSLAGADNRREWAGNPRQVHVPDASEISSPRTVRLRWSRLAPSSTPAPR